MKLLIIAPWLPMADRGSEELRFSEMLRILAAKHEVTLFVWSLWGQDVSAQDQKRYKAFVEDMGISIRLGHFRKVLKERLYDAVLIEWFHSMDHVGDDIRTWQPQAKIVVDAVDLEFRRLGIKANLTRDPSDIAKAADTRRRELAAYANADFIITVSDEEQEILNREIPGLSLSPVPNIHRFPETLPNLTAELVMIFVGDYRVPPNVDAVQYFCHDVLPLIHRRVPTARLLIVGNAPTDEIKAFASPMVTVTGYVPEVAPYLQKSRVSIAPLRFGAGMKGKVGEAMSCGIPVVTTSVGFQGMEMVRERDVLVADTPSEFADAVIRLFSDHVLCEQLRESAFRKMKERFSTNAAQQRLDRIMEVVAHLPSPEKKFSSTQRLRLKSVDWIERNVLWRLKSVNESARS
jgi:glycosyltransferase involved in cell wall biosynthesis